MDAGLLGWLGAALLLLSGAGWGAQVSMRGLTMPALLLTLGTSALGLALAADAFMHGVKWPLTLGVVGALGSATLMVFTGRK